jgi:hypothetical protein
MRRITSNMLALIFRNAKEVGTRIDSEINNVTRSRAEVSINSVQVSFSILNMNDRIKFYSFVWKLLPIPLLSLESCKTTATYVAIRADSTSLQCNYKLPDARSFADVVGFDIGKSMDEDSMVSDFHLIHFSATLFNESALFSSRS